MGLSYNRIQTKKRSAKWPIWRPIAWKNIINVNKNSKQGEQAFTYKYKKYSQFCQNCKLAIMSSFFRFFVSILIFLKLSLFLFNIFYYFCIIYSRVMRLIRYSLPISINIIIIVLIIIFQQANANVSPFDPSTINLVMKNKTPTIFLLTSSLPQAKTNKNSISNDKSEQNILFQFHKAAELYYQGHLQKIPALEKLPHQMLLFVVSDPNDGLFTYQKLTEYLGVYPQDSPSIVFLSHSHNKYLLTNKISITSQAIIQFLHKIQQNQYPIFYKSEQFSTLQKQSLKNKTVKTLIGLNFDQVVYSTDRQYVVLFYSPLNYNSRVLKLQFQKAAQGIKKNTNIIFAKVNVVKNQIVIKGGQQEYVITQDRAPLILYWRKNKKEIPLIYRHLKQYEVSYDYILKWLKQNTYYEWIKADKISEYAHEEQL